MEHPAGSATIPGREGRAALEHRSLVPVLAETKRMHDLALYLWHQLSAVMRRECTIDYEQIVREGRQQSA